MFRVDDLTLTDFRILSLLYSGKQWRHNVYTIKEFTSKLKLNKSTVYYRIEKVLVERGLIEKQNSYPMMYKPVFDEEVYTMVHKKINSMVDELWGIDR